MGNLPALLAAVREEPVMVLEMVPQKVAGFVHTKPWSAEEYVVEAEESDETSLEPADEIRAGRRREDDEEFDEEFEDAPGEEEDDGLAEDDEEFEEGEFDDDDDFEEDDFEDEEDE